MTNPRLKMSHEGTAQVWHFNRGSSYFLVPWTTVSYVLSYGQLQESWLQVAYSGKTIPSVLWHCWLGGRKGIWPVKELSGADLHTAQLMPLSLTVSCFSKIKIGFTFLVPAHPGSPGQRAVKRVYVCYSGKMWMSIVCHLKMHTVLITVRG